MKRIFSFVIVLALIVSMSACGKSNLYYDYNISDFITVKDYSNEVDRTSDTYASAYDAFYADAFGTDLEYEATEGVIEYGDTANIDYKGTLNGVAFEGGTSIGYDLTIGSGTFIDGFEEGLVGVTIGQTVNLDLTFPESYQSTELAGQAVVFEVKVNYATKKGKPTEDNVKRYGFKSLADYEEQADSYAVNVSMFYNIYGATTFNSYPEAETELLYNDAISQYETLCKQNGITVEQFASSNGLSLSDFKEYVSEYEVKNSMKFFLVAYYVLQINDQKLTEEDVANKKAELVASYGEDLEKVGYYEINIQQEAAYDKALEILSEKAQVKN